MLRVTTSLVMSAASSGIADAGGDERPDSIESLSPAHIQPFGAHL